MESTGGSMLGRLAEKLLGWVLLGLLIFLGIAVWRAGPEWRAAMWSRIWRAALWLGIAAGVPWLSRPFMSRILELGSNWAAAGLLGALLAVDALAGVLLMTGWPGGVWGWLAALCALAVAGTYNYLVSEYLAERSGG